MARNTGRTVYLRTDGRWANKANDALKASDLHDTQDEARAQANQMLADAGIITKTDAKEIVKGLDQISHAMGEGGVASTTIRNDLAKGSPLFRPPLSEMERAEQGA